MHTITIFSKSASFLTSYCSWNNLPIIFKFKCEKNSIKVSTLCNNISQEVNYLQSIVVSRKAVPVVNGFAFHFWWLAEKIWYMHYSWNYWYNVGISIVKLTKQAENTFSFRSVSLICIGNFRRSGGLNVFLFFFSKQ